MGLIKMTEQIMNSAKSNTGGWSKKQLKVLGYNDFISGWRKQALQRYFTKEVIEQFIALRKTGNSLPKVKPEKQEPFFVPCSPNISFNDQYKHPNWQKKRLLVLERDHFHCRICGSNSITLHVHHSKYPKGKFIWEAEGNTLITVCEVCHSMIHNRDLRLKK